MKKLITLAILLLSMTSCGPTLRRESDMGALSTHGMIRQEFQGHSYIVTKGPVSPVHSMHDPDCACQKSKLSGPSISRAEFGLSAPRVADVSVKPVLPVPSTPDLAVPVSPVTPIAPVAVAPLVRPVVTMVQPVLPSSVERTDPSVPLVLDIHQKAKRDAYLRGLAGKCEYMTLNNSPAHEVLEFLQNELVKLKQLGLNELRDFIKSELESIANPQAIKDIVQKIIDKLSN